MAMEVILLERVESLGSIGDVVKVKNGYARNFLFPQHKALAANEANKKRFERERANIERVFASEMGPRPPERAHTRAVMAMLAAFDGKPPPFPLG